MLDQEDRLAYNVPAAIANRFRATVGPNGVRIAFAECAPGETMASIFHSAVLLSESDALALAAVVRDTIERHRRRGR